MSTDEAESQEAFRQQKGCGKAAVSKAKLYKWKRRRKPFILDKSNLFFTVFITASSFTCAAQESEFNRYKEMGSALTIV